MPSSIDNYEVLEPIGAGTFGTCKKVRRKKDGKVLVWKEVDYSEMSEDAKQMLVIEVNLLRELRHENIVRYYDRIIDKARSTLYIVMEFCEGGDLASYIKKLKANQSAAPEEFIWQMCLQLASALGDCHSRSRNGNMVLHRDLKPANVFLDARRNAKIGDFGLARVLKPNASFAKTCVGTPYYMSPEQILGMEYNEKCDVWSLGCILYELCALRPPFDAATHIDLIQRITAGQPPCIPSQYSANLGTLIGSLLQVNPAKRPSVEAILSNPVVLARCTPLKASGVTPEPCTTGCGTALVDNCVMRCEVLRVREELLSAREQTVARREADLARLSADLEAREKNLAAKEKSVEERMTRAEQLIQEYAEARLRLITSSIPDDLPLVPSSEDADVNRIQLGIETMLLPTTLSNALMSSDHDVINACNIDPSGASSSAVETHHVMRCLPGSGVMESCLRGHMERLQCQLHCAELRSAQLRNVRLRLKHGRKSASAAELCSMLAGNHVVPV